MTLAKGRFPYFFCTGRAKGLTDCREPYVPASRVERQVEGIYGEIRLNEEARREVAARLDREIARRQSRAKAAARYANRLMRLQVERKKLLEALYDEAISKELFKSESRRIDREEAEIKDQVGVDKSALEQARHVAQRAMELLDGCRTAYLAAKDDARRRWNRAIFKAIYRGWPGQDVRISRALRRLDCVFRLDRFE